MNNSAETFGRKIKTLREHSCFTQSNIANFLKVDQSFISMVEKGERALTSDVIEKLEALFLVELKFFSRNGLTYESVIFYTSCN